MPRLTENTIEHVVHHFDGLAAILGASVSELNQVEGVGEVRARGITTACPLLFETITATSAPAARWLALARSYSAG